MAILTGADGAILLGADGAGLTDGASTAAASPVGSQADFAARLRAVLPARWFPDTAPEAMTSNTPILDALLAGIGCVWAQVYALLSYVTLQARIATATDVFLDLVGVDFFGAGMQRRPTEADAHYRARILASLLPPAGTRAALIAALVRLTGRMPVVFEPRNTMDTGGYGTLGSTSWSGLAYGAAGGYGCLAEPFQCFVTAYRPRSGGVACVAGWGAGAGGYGVGTIEYVGNDMLDGQVTDQDIYSAIAQTLPAGTIGWTAISS